MKAFVETTDFSKWRPKFLSEEDYAKMQQNSLRPRSEAM